MTGESEREAEDHGSGEARHFAVFLNKAAGSVSESEVDAHAAEIQKHFEAAGASADVTAVHPSELGEAMELAWSQPDRPFAIVIAGGDGTVNCAARRAVKSSMTLGVLPMGTFNHFAKDLGVPEELEEAVASLVKAPLRKVDVGDVNGIVFVNNATLGIYPTMVSIREQLSDSNGWGKVRAVPVAAMRTLKRLPLHRLDLEGPDYKREHLRTPFVWVGNGDYDNPDGGTFQRNSLDSGVLHVAVAHVVSRWGVVKTTVRSIVSGSDKTRDLEMLSLGELSVSSGAKRLLVGIDGEVEWIDTPLRFRSVSKGLEVLAPNGAGSA